MKEPILRPGWRWACRDKTKSPSVGIPVYVTDEALEKHGFPKEHRGGIIIEDWSLIDPKGKVHHGFLVKHKIGKRLWERSELVEIGGLRLNFLEEDT